MKKVIAVMALVIVALVAFSGLSSYAAGTDISLKALNNSGQDGTATFTDMGGGKTKVEISVSNGTADPQPAHIHKGTCANLDPNPTYPLTNVVNGKSETTIDASIESLQASQYAVNIHKSATDVATYTSCGEITGLAMTTSSGSSGELPASGGGSQALIFLALTALAIGVIAGGRKLARNKA
jgi:hypothetical protein